MAQNPPPKTVPSRASVKKTKTPTLEVDVIAEVVTDGTTTDAGTQGLTSLTSVGTADVGGSFALAPNYDFVTKNNQDLISKITSPAVVKGTVTIQTVYGPSSTAAQTSAYGRGTTPDDEKAGNTTLGFHESCHRADYLTYLRTKALPTFSGKVGQTVAVFDKASADFLKAVQKYFDDMDVDSARKTDEVGYKKSTFDAKGPRP